MNLRQFNHILRLVLVVPVAALLLMACALFWQMKSAHDAVSLIQSAGDDIAQSVLIEKLIVDEETGLRGFQITGDPGFLQPYIDAQPQIEQNLQHLEAAANAAATPQVKANRLKLVEAVRAAQAAWKHGFAEPLIATVRAGGHTDDVGLNLQGRKQMDELRTALRGVAQVSQRRADVRAERWHQQAKKTFYYVGVLALLVGIILGLFMRRLLQQVTKAYSVTLEVMKVRAEEAFRSEEKLRTTLASIGDGVITCDLEGRVDTMNTVAQQLTGWTQEEARHQPLEDILTIISETTREPVSSPLKVVRTSENAVRLPSHTVLVRKDKSEIMIDDSGAPIRDETGELIGFVLVFRDVTMARKSQAALIANEKLAVSGRLAATIAHEIHNPLDSVSNLLFLMDGVASPEESAHFLSLAKQEIARVTQISRAMLSLYRESRAPVPIELCDTLESILLLMERRFVEQGIHISMDIPEDAVIYGFPAELRQVFTNLLTNAAEAAGQGGSVRVTAEAVPDSLGQAIAGQPDPRAAGFILTFRDTGAGIPEDIRQHLFQPFFTTKGERGTGLGLWVSQGIILRHGGEIDIESDTTPENHHTSVRVYLALDPTIQPAAA